MEDDVMSERRKEVRKIKYDKKVLEELILEKNLPYVQIGKMYNISANAIKKAALKLGICLPRRRIISPKENFVHRKHRPSSLVWLAPDDTFVSAVKSSQTWKEIGTKLGYTNRLSSNVKLSIENRCSSMGIEVHRCLIDNYYLNDKTKREVFEASKSWQAGRATIQRMARQVFFENNDNPRCHICGYDKHIEVAHVKAVSNFSGDTKLKEINSVDNLIGLCPNHHWEYDNGLLKL